VIAHLNPFFYLIDGMRFGFTGHADGTIWLGMLVVLLVDLALWLLAQRLIARGWRLKA
jgi:ABC-2 type transport system permease protein